MEHKGQQPEAQWRDAQRRTVGDERDRAAPGGTASRTHRGGQLGAGPTPGGGMSTWESLDRVLGFVVTDSAEDGASCGLAL